MKWSENEEWRTMGERLVQAAIQRGMPECQYKPLIQMAFHDWAVDNQPCSDMDYHMDSGDHMARTCQVLGLKSPHSALDVLKEELVDDGPPIS